MAVRGLGYGSTTGGYLNDLWRYDLATNHVDVDERRKYDVIRLASTAQRACRLLPMCPGARDESISWTDSHGNLWLFGGNGKAAHTSGRLNDLWRYDPATNQWTWMSGSNTINQVGVYGTKGVPDAANVPGARNIAFPGQTAPAICGCSGAKSTAAQISLAT